MIYGPLNGKMAEFEYDCRNRLVSAGGISYEYDAENNRISQTENGAKTEYVVDSNSSSLTRILTAEKEGDTTYYIYGIGLIAQENGNEYLIYHFNNIGSTEAVTNIDGEIVETFDYGPYGELLSENKCGIMFLYNGELGVATDSNGLYYMRARYYNPEIKRFINQDVMTGSITDTPTLNRYAYVNGNPISLNDPFGLSPFLNWLDGITGHDILDLLGMLPGIGFVFDELVHIGVNGETISATPTHPFYVDKLGWTLARSLRAGDILVLSNGELVTVEWVQHEILESPIKVYNFEVEDFHTYFVGENGIFVHNGCGDNSWNDYQKEHAGEGKNRSELAAEYNATKPVKSTNSKGKVHGNSLDYEGTNYGYELKDRTTGETLKYGESIDPQKRYSQAELDRYNADMYIQVQGSKREIHNWQHEKILDYMYVTDQHPLLNKSLW